MNSTNARTRNGRAGRPVLTLVAGLALAASTSAPPWGEHGHLIAGRAAAVNLPGEMPGFFRTASGQLSWLNPEPDRRRDGDLREMNEAFRYDHYVDMENLLADALGSQAQAEAVDTAPDRYRYLEVLFDSELPVPVRDAGFLHLRIVELYQRLETGFRQWRTAPGPEEQGFIEARIINDAGILGHYVTDGSQPHHTTIHFNGWSSRVPNPEGYSTSREIHSRFESGFVGAHIAFENILPRVSDEPRVLGDVREAVWAFLLESNGEVERLYQLERDFGFDPGAPADPETREFVVERLVAGVEMLRDLWWTAWVNSAG
jgi:hypothetical protein